MKFRRTQNPNAEMPFLDHLEELRWRILWSLLALTLFSIIGIWVVMQFDVIAILKHPIDPYLPTPDAKLPALDVTGPFFISVKLGVAIGIIAASPILFYHVWSFLSPALVPRERRAIVPALYLGLVLFAAGAALAYFAALPFTLRIMSQMQSATLVWMPTADNYFSFVVKLLLGFGVMFEMPVVIMVLTAVGLASSRFLAAKRRYAIAVMAILAAMITPGDVIVPTLILLGPLMLLYELSIVLARVVEKKRKLATEASENEILPEALT